MMNNLQCSQRYTGPDILKLACAFLVVCIHTASIMGASRFDMLCLLPITRIAVPLFFMISGFFYARLQEGAKLKQLKKVFILLVFSLALFTAFELLRLSAHGEALALWFTKFATADYWLNFLLFNDPDISMHLWYLCALFYVLLILFFAEKRISLGRLYILIPILLLLNLLLGTYASALFFRYLHIRVSRNFLFCGLPFFLLGHYIYARRPRFQNRLILLAALLSLLGSLAENYVIIRLGREFNLDIFICTPIFALSVFLLVLQNEARFSGRAMQTAAGLGRKTSTAVFIMHPMVIYLLPEHLHGCTLAAAVMVFAVCTAAALIIRRLLPARRKSPQPVQ